MLVLSRKRREVIMIGDDIIITVIEVGRDRVRIGFEAPAKVVVLRKEVYDRIKREENPEADPDSFGHGASESVQQH